MAVYVRDLLKYFLESGFRSSHMGGGLISNEADFNVPKSG